MGDFMCCFARLFENSCGRSAYNGCDDVEMRVVSASNGCRCSSCGGNYIVISTNPCSTNNCGDCCGCNTCSDCGCNSGYNYNSCGCNG